MSSGDRFNDDFASMLDVFRGSLMRDLRVAFPAQVTAYDASTQLASVKPLVAEWFAAEGETDVEQVPLPVVPNVPVVQPGAGGFRVTFPVQVGDVVEVIVSDRSLDAWLDQGGSQAPSDLRRHHLTDAVAIPGLHDNKHPWTAPTDGATFGKDGGPLVKVTNSAVLLGDGTAAQAVILGNAFKTALDTMLAAVQAYVAAAAVPSAGAAAALTAWNTALATFDSAFSAALSATVKVRS